MSVARGSETVAALVLPPALMLAVGPRGVGVALTWAVLTGLIGGLVVLGFMALGPTSWGPTNRVGTAAVASLLAALLAAWIFAT